MSMWLAAADIWSMLPKPDRLAEIAVNIGFTVFVAFVLQRGLYLAIRRLEKLLTQQGSHASTRRAKTLGQVIRRFVTTIVVGIALIHVLEILGWDVKPLLAGAGIIGVGIGFGAQSLVRDLIAGMFILTENLYSVGDLIEINGKPATVEELSMRRTMLRDFNGYVHFVPNGEMKIVVNRSRDWNRLAVDVVIAADENLDRAIEVCRDVLQKFNADPAWRERLLDPVELWGIETMSGQEAMIRCVVRSIPGSGAPDSARELRRQLQRALTTASVRTGTSREVTVVRPDAPAPARAETPPPIEPEPRS